jgi:predicted HicB family RNase H-like nuclease
MNKPKLKLTEAEAALALREGDYWDKHSLAEVWEKTRPVQMDVDLQTRSILIRMGPRLAAQLEKTARRQRLSVEKWLTRLMERELAEA